MFCPFATRDTSKEVPPISPVIILLKPAALAISLAATTPAAGPDKAVFIGRDLAVSMDITPPLDCTIKISVVLFFSLILSSIRAR